MPSSQPTSLNIAVTMANLLIAAKGSEHMLQPENLEKMRKVLGQELDALLEEEDADAADEPKSAGRQPVSTR
jgi:hypothetical protein